jgi:hypothetical protein
MNVNNSKCKSEQRLINKLDSKLPFKSMSQDEVYLRNKNQYEYVVDPAYDSSAVLMYKSAHKADNKTSSNTALYVILLILMTFLTCMSTIFLTCLFIRKNFVVTSVKEKQHQHQQSSSSGSSTSSILRRPRSFILISNSITEFVYKYIFARDEQAGSMLVYNEKLDISCMEQQQQQKQLTKVSNVYELSGSKSVGNGAGGGMKPVSVVCSRPNSASSSSDLPATTTTTSSSIGSNNNSPNNLCSTISTNLLTTSKFSSIDGDVTSASEESTSCEHEAASARKFKRTYQIQHQQSLVKQDSGVTTNLLIAGSNINNV